jgi:hypothetical protein
MQMLSFRSVVLIGTLSALAGAARAAGPFADDPQNHWAYTALDRAAAEGLLGDSSRWLQDTLKPASRYEMAVEFQHVYSSLRASNQPDRQDIDDTIRASHVFESELAKLGVDVPGMRQSLMAMSMFRQQAEAKKPAVDIRGETDFWVGAGSGRDSSYGLDKDGRIVGTSNPVPGYQIGSPVLYEANLQRDYTFLHEGAFSFSSANPKGISWNGTLVLSDMFGNANAGTYAFGNQSDAINPTYGYGVTGYRDGQEDLYLQDAGIKFGGSHANVTVGRLGYSVSPYIYQRADNTTYFASDRWDNGLYYFDGAILGFDFGRAKLDVFGGRNSGLTSTNDVDVDPLRTGPYDGPLGTADSSAGTRLTMDNSIGANLKLALGSASHVDLAYLYLNSNSDQPMESAGSFFQANRLDVYGADASTRLGPIALQGGYHKSDLMENGTSVNSSDNSAWNLRLAADQKRFSLFGEYREIEANYLAPGDWGRLGVLRNPTNIKGFRLGGSLDVTPRITLSANGEFDQGVSDNFAESTFLGSHTGINMFDVKLDYKLRHNLSVYGEYEDTHFGSLAASSSYAGSGDPYYRWATFGLGYGFASNTRFDIRYELSDVYNDYQISNGVAFHGGFLTTQLTIKF